MTVQIDLGELPFNTFTPDGDGVTWLITQWEGWETPTINLSTDTLAGRDGSTTSPSFMRSRTLTYQGVVKAPDVDTYEAALQSFLAMAYGSRNTPVDVTHHESTSKFATGKMATTPKITKAASHFTFQINLFCKAPLKYSVDEQTLALTGTHTVVNGGTQPMLPKVVTSASGAVDIQNTTVTGNPRVKTSTLPSGSTIDFKTFSLSHTNFNDSFNALDSGASQWWPLKAGSNTIVYSGPAAELRWRDAWL